MPRAETRLSSGTSVSKRAASCISSVAAYFDVQALKIGARSPKKSVSSAGNGALDEILVTEDLAFAGLGQDDELV